MIKFNNQSEEKKNHQKLREKERKKNFVRKNYSYNGRENVKFILNG